MAYNPPSPTNWVFVHRFDLVYARAYQEGYQAAGEGQKLDDNPYESSNHERDSSHQDELHFWWYCGHCACEERGT